MAAVPSRDNLVLGVLSPDNLKTLSPEVVVHEAGDVLFSPDETPEFVYFPHTNSVVSLVRATAEGTTVESGIVGSEGVLSVHSLIDEPGPTRCVTIMQLRGPLTRIGTSTAREWFEIDATFRQAVLAYTSSFLSDVMQNTVCNRLHTIEQRLAKWLLTVRDRHNMYEMRLTHEFLSHMLGVQRAGVTLAINALEVDGVIEHRRNRVAIRDLEGLLARSCECYGVLRESLVKLRATLLDPRRDTSRFAAE